MFSTGGSFTRRVMGNREIKNENTQRESYDSLLIPHKHTMGYSSYSDIIRQDCLSKDETSFMGNSVQTFAYIQSVIPLHIA